MLAIYNGYNIVIKLLQLYSGELNIHCPWIYVIRWFRSEAKLKKHAYIIERYRVVWCNRFCPIQTLNTCIILWISDTVHTCSNMKEQVYSIIHWFCSDAKLWMQLSWILAFTPIKIYHETQGQGPWWLGETINSTHHATQNQTNGEWEGKELDFKIDLTFSKSCTPIKTLKQYMYIVLWIGKN